MPSILPQTGTMALLEVLSRFIPDDFINGLSAREHRHGRRPKYRAAQLYRILLLPLLTPARSFNLTVELLKEHRSWRQFAHLPNRHDIPDASLLHDFRARLGVSGLRAINTHLLKPLLSASNLGATTVALIDSTDLPAATGNNYKKSMTEPTRPKVRPRATGRSRAGRAVGLPVIKSTRCAFGSTATIAPSNWFR